MMKDSCWVIIDIVCWLSRKKFDTVNYKKILFSLIAIVTVAYPFIVYFSLDKFGPSLLSLALFIILLARVIIRGEFQRPEQYAQLILVGGLCVIAAWFNSEELLRYYPVMMNLAFAGFFMLSLSTETSLVERFAEMFMKEVPNEGRPYMRSMVWALILTINAAIAFYTACCLSLKVWTFYNGFLAYIFLGGFMAIELGYRQIHIRKLKGK